MFFYTKKGVNLISIIFTIILFLIIENRSSIFNENLLAAYDKTFFYTYRKVSYILNNNEKSKENKRENKTIKNNIYSQAQIKEISNAESVKDTNGMNENSNNNKTINIEENYSNLKENDNNLKGKENEIASIFSWQIAIPKIDLIAEISEGTQVEVMNKYVGHFENTSQLNGNVALAAHNRGYPVNYFANIKKLVKGDEIYYTFNGVTKKYKVEIITVIQDIDWTYLQTTQDNRITLITCVENEPDYRRCIQGIERIDS